MRRLVYAIPIVIVAVLGIYFAVGLSRDPGKLPSALIDKPAPEFSLPPIVGEERGFSSSDLAGKVTLVNVWASWCVPCAAEMPVLVRIARKGVPIYGINYKDRPQDALAFLERLGNPYIANGADTTGRAIIDWGVYGYPETFIVDQNKVIRYKHIGPITDADWERTLAPVVEKLRQR